MNNTKKIIVLMLLLSGVFSILTGCMDNDYNKFSEKFNDIYLDIASSVDISDTVKTLKNIQSEENREKINELKVLLDDIQEKVSDDKKDEYEQLKDWYKGLIILRDTPHDEWDKLSFKEKSNVWAEIGLIDIIRRK